MMKSLMAKIFRIVVEPCLEGDEPYAVRSRKLAVIAFSMITSNAIVMGIPVIAISEVYEPSNGRRITQACGVFVGIASSIVPYLYLRKTRKLPDWVPDLQMWSVVPNTLCFSLLNHHTSSMIVVTVCTLISIVVRVRGWYVLLVYGVALNALHALINDFAGELPQLHSTFHDIPPLSIRVLYLMGSGACPLLFFGLGLHLIIKEWVDRANQADAAIAMNLAVADKLRRYDTDGVAVILTANKGKVDEKLLEAFSAIQHNLEEYRPHIPDYVIAATMSSEGPDMDEDEGAIATSSRFSLASVLTNSNKINSSENRGDGGEDPSQLTDTRRSSVANKSDGIVVGEPINVNEGRGRSSLHRSTLSGHKEGCLNTSQYHDGSGGYNSINKDRVKQRPHFSGRATTVYVRFVSVDGFVVIKGKSGISTAMSTLNNCVDAASKHAKTHKGALQYMQGCGLMVSFNAASRVATHEANACAFALALKTSVEELLHSDLVMHATIVTTNVLSFFAGNSGQLMLTVLGEFMPVHTAKHHYLSQTVGKAASCVLISNSTVRTIDMMYDHRLLGGVSHMYHRRLSVGEAESPPLDDINVSELLSEKNNGEDEWLYQAAERDKNDPITRSNNAVRAALDGDAVPVEFSTQCDTSDVVLMKCVKERLEWCSRDESPFEVRTMTPTVMW